MNSDNKHLILIADDDQVALEAYELLLEQYNIIKVENGRDALIKAKEYAHTLNLILLDVVMPGIGGIKTCKLLKKNTKTRNIPVIFLTVKDEPKSVSDIFNAGAVDFIPKSSDFRVINARVKVHLELKDHRDNLERKVERLTRELRNEQEEVTLTLSGVLGYHSEETKQHVERVSLYSELLANLATKSNNTYREYKLSDRQILLIKNATPMHDIGKIAIPDIILSKPGRLCSKEKKIMQGHSIIGYQIMKFSKRPILMAARGIAKSHHERWDGNGYPQRLKGKQIPLFSRIVAIADSFDAMANKRIYKDMIPIEKIKDEFKKEQGKQFDPILTELFLNNFDCFVAILNSIKDNEIDNIGASLKFFLNQAFGCPYPN